MWTASERQAAKAVSVLVGSLATVVLVIALQIVGRIGHANVVPVAPPKHVEPGPIDHDDDDTGVRFALTLRTAAGFVGTTLAAALASAGGIGGGALYVSLFYVGCGFSLKAATGLSQAAIAGGSFASMIFNLLLRHPWDPGRPLVDLDLALALTPALLLGVSIGVLLNELLPVWAVLGLLFCLLAHTSRAVLIRGLNAWVEERQRVAAANAAAAIHAGPVPRLAPICIAHVPSATALAPRRLQVVISREASRAQMADSSDDEDASGARRGAVLAAVAAAAAAAEASLCEEGGGGGAAGGLRRAASAKSPMLDTVPSGDSEQMGSDASAALASLDGSGASSGGGGPERRRRGGGPSPGGGGSGGGGGGGGSSDGEEDAFARALAAQHLRLPAGPDGHASPPGGGGDGSSFGIGSGGGAGGGGNPYFGGWRDEATPLAPPPLPPPAGDRPASWPGTASPRARARFPWIKLVSLALLWLGFLGLSAIDALLPLCSFVYIAYLLLFVATTLGVTAMFVRAIFLEPARAASSGARSPSRKPWLERRPLSAVAEEAGGGGGGSGGARQPLLGSSGGNGSSSGFGQGTPTAAEEPEDGAGDPPASLSVVAALSAAIAGAAGLLAGTVGLGGGSMLDSALLDFRVHPQVASATSSVLLFISSSAATLSYVMEGRLIFSYAAAFAACAAAGSVLGVVFVAGAVRRSARPSAFVLALAAAVAAGAALDAALGGWDAAAAARRGAGGGLSTICR